MATKVKRATVNLDADLLDEAARALGTVGTTATLNGALSEVVRRRRLADLAATEFPDLTLKGVEELRRWRTDGTA
jgi:Arc/MetJ family transcription regulator